MNLKQFADLAGCEVVLCGPGWGGRYGYTTDDAPNCTTCGFKTKTQARQAWLGDTFGEVAGGAVQKLLSSNVKLRGAPFLARPSRTLCYVLGSWRRRELETLQERLTLSNEILWVKLRHMPNRVIDVYCDCPVLRVYAESPGCLHHEKVVA